MDIRLICLSFASSLFAGCFATSGDVDTRKIMLISDCQGNYVEVTLEKEIEATEMDITR